MDHAPAAPSPTGAVPPAFYARPVLAVAADLLGRVLLCTGPDGTVGVRLTEVEAYGGAGEDPGSHAFRGPTPRTGVMFGEPGHAYVYLSYGVHWCLNLVCEPAGRAAAVLLRAGEVVSGAALARARRPGAPDRDLARGPALLTRALGVDRGDDGRALDGTRLAVVGPAAAAAPVSGPRVGVSGEGGVRPWRLWLPDEPTVSRYRASAPRRGAGRDGAPVGGSAP